MELYRMFGNKKLWLLLFLCMVITCMSLSVYEYRTVQYSYDGSVEQMQKETKNTQTKYFKEWQEKVSDIISGSDVVVSIFRKKKGFVVENREKTAKAYREIKQCRLATGNDELVNAIVQNHFSAVLCIGFLLFVIFALLEERRCNLWPILYAGKEGRGKLGVQKIITLFFWCVTANLLLLGSQIIYTCIYYGIRKNDWVRPIQSLMTESDCVFPIQVWQYFIWYFFITTVGYVVVSMFLYVVLQSFRTRKLGLFFLVLFIGMEYLSYRLIEVQSSLVLIKYINVFSFLFPEQVMFHYSNINLFEHAYARFCVMGIAGVLLLVCLCFSSVILSIHMKPIHTKGHLEQLISRIAAFWKEKWYDLQFKLSYRGLEIYRVLIMHRALLILIVVGLVMIKMSSYEAGFYDAKTQFKEEYYEQFHGSCKRKAYDYLLEKENEINKLRKQYDISLQKYRDSKMDYEQLQSEKLYLDQQIVYEEAISELKQEYMQIKLRRAQGEQVVIVNQNTYERIFGKNSEYEKKQMAFFLFVIILTSYFDYFSSDSRKGIRFVVKAAKNGRSNYVRYKFRAVLGTNIIFLSVLSLIRMISLFCQYDPKDLSAPLSSVFLCENYPISLSIGQFFVLLMVCRLISMTVISAITLFWSEVSGGYKGVLMSMAVMGGEELVITQLSGGRLLTLAQGLSGIPLSYLSSTGELMGYFFFCIIICAVSGILVTKHWNEK